MTMTMKFLFHFFLLGLQIGRWLTSKRLSKTWILILAMRVNVTKTKPCLQGKKMLTASPDSSLKGKLSCPSMTDRSGRLYMRKHPQVKTSPYSTTLSAVFVHFGYQFHMRATSGTKVCNDCIDLQTSSKHKQNPPV